MTKFNNNSKGSNREGGHKPAMKKRKSVTSVTYVKSFDSFEEAITDMIANNDIVYSILSLSEDDITEEEVYNKICSLPTKYTPNPVTRENILWEYTISANRVSIKTDQFIAFGWNIRSRKVDDHFESTYYCKITIFGNNAMAKKALEDADWKLEERKNNGRN